MKNILIYSLFFTNLLSLPCISCKSNSLQKTKSIKNASYKIYNIRDEKGYEVVFNTTGKGMDPIAVTLNRIRQEIKPSDKENSTYHINLIAETRRIHDYTPQQSFYGNGVIFKIDSTEYFKPVKFILK
ncbi:hypothetical protein GNY06_09795 [Elizabethkingia argentiflava]|uniref:Uncharacterized protein n=1 Tax=Elizabethkingia argenteiflava TaxID=2681556 RepID=A0A845PZZ8_9FLAO|nr:hypothetical protein [Elizabethkingia argenteiflava]NAW51650.1 hypothetical protein [Elizabethkingia argenteiflava]